MGCQSTKDKRSTAPLIYEIPQSASGRPKSSRSPQQTPRSARSRTPRSRSRTPRDGGRTPRDSKEEGGGFHPRDQIPQVPYDTVEFELSYFEKLPSSSIKRNVFSAYDGDSLTLRGEDNAKVRLLAIDTPEVQFNEPYAEEGRLFTNKHCVGKDVYLTFEAEREDRYGRLLAMVFVKDSSKPPNKFFCVNVGVLEAGLATYYHPQHSELTLDTILLQAQKKARDAKINIWRDVDEDAIVYLTANGKAFHTKTCTSIEHSALTSTTIRDALDEGRNPCRDCHPQWATKLSNHSSGAQLNEARKEGNASAPSSAVATSDHEEGPQQQPLVFNNKEEPVESTAAAADALPVVGQEEEHDEQVACDTPNPATDETPTGGGDVALPLPADISPAEEEK